MKIRISERLYLSQSVWQLFNTWRHFDATRGILLWVCVYVCVFTSFVDMYVCHLRTPFHRSHLQFHRHILLYIHIPLWIYHIELYSTYAIRHTLYIHVLLCSTHVQGNAITLRRSTQLSESMFSESPHHSKVVHAKWSATQRSDGVEHMGIKSALPRSQIHAVASINCHLSSFDVVSDTSPRSWRLLSFSSLFLLCTYRRAGFLHILKLK